MGCNAFRRKNALHDSHDMASKLYPKENRCFYEINIALSNYRAHHHRIYDMLRVIYIVWNLIRVVPY